MSSFNTSKKVFVFSDRPNLQHIEESKANFQKSFYDVLMVLPLEILRCSEGRQVGINIIVYMRYVKLREACERSGLHPHTIRKYADTGAIPSVRTPGGQPPPTRGLFGIDAFLGRQVKTGIVLYARVSSYKQRDDLDRQIEYLTSHYPGCEVIVDIASGLNFKRKGLRAILGRSLSGDQLTLVVAHRDRLARFGFELIEWLIERSPRVCGGGRVVVLSKSHLAYETKFRRPADEPSPMLEPSVLSRFPWVSWNCV